jgi:hypothetical protein
MEFKLDIPKKQFLAHLDLKNNYRIIFSGGFGTGKTYFLDDFFKEHEKYEAIHIYPVNYSVSSNEDIFELIKYDILFKLLEKGLDFESIEIDKGAFLPFFLNNHATEIIPTLLGLIPKVGASMKDISKGLIDLNTKFKEEFENANLTDQDKIITYLQEFTQIKGSITEEDLYTQMISALVNQLKENGKEIILIIDDLDRIDPEHVFRIMNVLAAHVDIKMDSEQNKFDFDKIILVCDIDNIRRIFANRYGADVDFSGYIDKFYSRSIFHYDLSAEMIKSVNQVFNAVVLDYGRHEMSLGEVRKDVAGAIIKQILHSFLQYNLISIRVLKRIFFNSQNLRERTIWKKGDYNSLTNSDIELVKAIDFLLFLFQDYEQLIEKCKILINKDVLILDNVSNHFFISQIIKAATFKDHWKNTNERPKEAGKDLEFETELNKLALKFRIERVFDSYNVKDKYSYRINSASDENGVAIEIDHINFFGPLVALLEMREFEFLLNKKFEVD